MNTKPSPASQLRMLRKLFGRVEDLRVQQTNDERPKVEVIRFPRSKANVPLSESIIYITNGMSAQEMFVPSDVPDIPKRIELTAYSNRVIETRGKTDFISWIMHWLSHLPFQKKSFLASGQTFNIGRPIIPGSDMSAYYFAETPIVDANILFATFHRATGFVHLVPISEKERCFAVDNGSNALLELFDLHKVAPLFDLQRRSVL